MTDSYAPHLVGQARNLGDGRFGVLVEHGGRTYYVEHAVAPEGLRNAVWDEEDDQLVVERTMDWDEVLTRLLATWQPGSDIGGE